MKKLLYPAREARAAIGCGNQKFYNLINNGTLDARRFGKRTYITGESLERFVASLPEVITPTKAKAEHAKWLLENSTRSKAGEDEPGAPE
jgi:hypothetical protein